ncbi:hypothetical protein KAS42_04530 [bacterium]|nr:hypothetical protein [bacterium]
MKTKKNYILQLQKTKDSNNVFPCPLRNQAFNDKCSDRVYSANKKSKASFATTIDQRPKTED